MSADTEAQLLDTYAAALQHDLIELPPGTQKVGVVRRPTPWLWAEIDENQPALGPPDPLLSDFQARVETLTDRGLDEVAAHNRAMVDVRYDDRYRRHLRASAAASEAIETIQQELEAGTDVALVCFENTDEKGCHRTLLREHIVDD